jgi:hypothetical protein
LPQWKEGVKSSPSTLSSILRELTLTTRQVSVGANNHHANWFECILSCGQPSAHEEIGQRSASLGHLLAISFQLKRSLRWELAREVLLGDDEANRPSSLIPAQAAFYIPPSRPRLLRISPSNFSFQLSGFSSYPSSRSQ